MLVCSSHLLRFRYSLVSHIVQAVDRALIVDTLPPAEQADANAWAARMLGVGSVAGYFMSVPFNLSLPTTS